MEGSEMGDFEEFFSKSVPLGFHRSLHSYLFYGADWIRTVAPQSPSENPESKRRVEIFKYLGSVSFMCFSVESFLNFVGAFEFGNAWNERDNVDTKFDKIVDKLALRGKLNRGSRPYQTIRLAFDC